jgi:hypothetical protein
MHRRSLLVRGTMILLFFTGCTTSNSENENPGGGNTSDDESNEMPRDQEGMDEAGTPMIQVHAKVTDDHPDDVTPISPQDERLAGIGLFQDLFEEVEDAAQENSDEELFGELFGVMADREKTLGKEAEDAMDDLPLIEQTVKISGSESTEEGIYVDYEGHTLFMFFRLFHED